MRNNGFSIMENSFKWNIKSYRSKEQDFKCFYFLFFNTQPIKLDDLFTGLSSKGINGSFFFFIQYIKKFKFSSQLAVVKHIQLSLDFSRLIEGLFRLIGKLNNEKISCKLKGTKAPLEAQFERW